MSHKRPSKRSRPSLGEAQGQYSPANEYFQPKRPRVVEHAEQEESSVRRSSRAPKPKLFDDEYLDTYRSSFDDNEPRTQKERTLSPTAEPDSQFYTLSSVVHDFTDSSRRKSSRPPKPKVFNEDFIDSPRNKLDSKSAGARNEEDYSSYSDNIKQHSTHKKKDDKKDKQTSKVSQKEKLVVSHTKDSQIAMKGSSKSRKSGSKKLSYYADSQLQESTSFLGEQLSPKVVDTDESSKVRHSSRTPKPKKTFALIEDTSFDDSKDNSDEEGATVNVISDVSITPKSATKSSKKHNIRQGLHSQSSVNIFANTEEIQTPSASKEGRKKESAKLDSSAKKSKKKSKKVKPEAEMVEDSEALVVDIIGVEIERQEKKKDGKEKSKKSSNKSRVVSKDKLDITCKESSVLETDNTKVKKKSKKKTERVESLGTKAEGPLEKTSSKHSSNEHSKKTHSKHSKAKHDRPHSETEDKDKHIILKLHLPHTETTSHSHSHKKHKHKHHSSENKTESLSSDGKAKKRKLQMDASCSSASEEKHKKVSIKFKGLSKKEPDVEVDTEALFTPPNIGKTGKEPEVKKKKSKKHSHDGATPLIPTHEQEHVKVIIKKSKKEVKVVEAESKEKQPNKTPAKEPKPKPKETKVVSKESEQKKPKSSPKKKSKSGGTPGKSPNDKEKKKIVTGYLLFCKSKRSQIAEANPELVIFPVGIPVGRTQGARQEGQLRWRLSSKKESSKNFPQISQKVGETWNNLPNEEKQIWKDKATSIKAKLNINVEKKDDKKHDGVKSGPDVVDMAAHLKLLGESLGLIGASLMAQRGTEVHGSLSVLLDSILCAICPLTFLTSHIPGIPGVAKEKQVKILDDLAYTMPGLG